VHRYTGGCHCGAVRYEADMDLSKGTLRCNCSMCTKSGYLHLIVTKAQFRLTSVADSLTTYQFNTGTAQHLFCSVCGIKSFYVPRSHPDRYSVNARCLDAGTVTEMKVTQADGVNWERSHPQSAIARKPSRAAVEALLRASELPAADLTDAHMEHFFYCGPASAPLAAIGIELCGSSVLLRSLVVRPGHRSAGLGAALVEHSEAYARAHGARAIYLLTTTADAFFARLGYAPVDRSAAPSEIRATREFAEICPASSTFMLKRI